MGALNLDTIASGQLQPYQTSNDADAELESAMTGELVVDLSAGNHVLTGAEFTRAILFETTGNSIARSLTTPATQRLFVVQNSGSHALDVKTGSTTISVAIGDAAIFYTDGTTNGLITIVGSSGASGTAGGDLTGTYPNPTIKTSVALGGSPTTTTQSPGDNTTKISTTAFVAAAISAIVGGLVYKGLWNALTNSPTITSGVGTLGWFYKVGTAGTTTVDGISVWNVGDMLLFDGTVWDKIDGQISEVISVAGRTGVVVLSSADLTDGVTGSGGAVVLATGPTMTNPIVGTQTLGDNTTKAASTAFVTAAIGAGAPPSGTAGGDLTGTYPNPTITAAAVTLAKMANLAASSIIGNNTGSPATPLALTAAQVKTLLAIASGDVSGLATSATTDTTNASNISSGTLAAARVGAIRMYISTFLAGLQTSATQRILRYHVAIAMTWPSSGSKASASAASTGTPVFTVKQNGSSIGTITFTTSATGVVAVTGGPLTFAVDDVIDIFGPASPDATLADIAITLATTAAGA